MLATAGRLPLEVLAQLRHDLPSDVPSDRPHLCRVADVCVRGDEPPLALALDGLRPPEVARSLKQVANLYSQLVSLLPHSLERVTFHVRRAGRLSCALVLD